MTAQAARLPLFAPLCRPKRPVGRRTTRRPPASRAAHPAPAAAPVVEPVEVPAVDLAAEMARSLARQRREERARRVARRVAREWSDDEAAGHLREILIVRERVRQGSRTVVMERQPDDVDEAERRAILARAQVLHREARERLGLAA